MSVFGIGGPEVILIILLIVLVLGPERAPQAARAIGRQWRRLLQSEWWQTARQMNHFVRNLPQALSKLGEIEEIQTQLAQELETVQQVQHEITSISKPVQEVLSGKPLQQALQTVEAEIKQSLPQEQKPTSQEATQGVQAAEAPPQAPTSTVPPAQASADAALLDQVSITLYEETLKLGQEVASYIDRLPTVFARLDELENKQAQLLDHIQNLQESIHSLLSSKEDGDQTNPATHGRN